MSSVKQSSVRILHLTVCTCLIQMRSLAMDNRDALKLHIPGKETPTQQDVNPQLLRLPSNGADSLSSPPVLTVDGLAQDEARMQQFLTSNYHLLCKRIFMSLDLFFSWLRSCGVFTIHDQELVEHTYPIKLDKAGKTTYHCHVEL